MFLGPLDRSESPAFRHQVSSWGATLVHDLWDPIDSWQMCPPLSMSRTWGCPSRWRASGLSAMDTLIITAWPLSAALVIFKLWPLGKFRNPYLKDPKGLATGLGYLGCSALAPRVGESIQIFLSSCRPEHCNNCSMLGRCDMRRHATAGEKQPKLHCHCGTAWNQHGSELALGCWGEMTSNIPKGPGCLAGVRVPRAHPGLTRQATSCDANLDLKLTLSGSIIYDVINIFKTPVSALIKHQVLLAVVSKCGTQIPCLIIVSYSFIVFHSISYGSICINLFRPSICFAFPVWRQPHICHSQPHNDSRKKLSQAIAQACTQLKTMAAGQLLSGQQMDGTL